MIKGVTVNGDWLTDPNVIKQAFYEFSANKFAAQPTSPVRLAVWDYGSDKAPGPDGFNFTFIKRYSDILKEEVVKTVVGAFQSKQMPRGSGSTFITLIPKVKNPSFIKDYRPISLIGVIYKFITKILTNRLASVLDDIISNEQSAFVAGRQILDGPLILNETIEWYKKKKEKLMIFKIDFEKAYDCVSWEFLDFMLKITGVGHTWRSWIRMVLTSARTSVLVNGSPTNEFVVRRGLRQGDPLSPFIFLIVMEGLHIRIKEKLRVGALHGASVGNPSFSLSHLFYADDAIFVCKWKRDNLEAILHALDIFHSVSTLAINMHYHMAKSALYGIGTSDREFDSMVEIARCTKGSTNDNRKIHWIHWDQALASKENGGLSIGSIHAFNHALLLKWMWRFFMNKESIWVSVIKAIYGSDGGINGIVKGSSVWISIVKLFHKLKADGSLPNNVLRVKVGNGNSIRFWKDNWKGDGTLACRYNRLLHLDADPECLLSSRLVNDKWAWEWVRGIGPRNLANLNQLTDFLGIFWAHAVFVMLWILGNGPYHRMVFFNVSDTHKFLDDGRLPSMVITSLWVKEIPRKINIFLWRVSWDRFSTRLIFSKRDLWSKIRVWVDVNIPILCSWASWIEWYNNLRLSSDAKIKLYAIVGASLWHIWRYRNSVLFGTPRLKKEILFDSIQKISFNWILKQEDKRVGSFYVDQRNGFNRRKSPLINHVLPDFTAPGGYGGPLDGLTNVNTGLAYRCRNICFWKRRCDNEFLIKVGGEKVKPIPIAYMQSITATCTRAWRCSPTSAETEGPTWSPLAFHSPASSTHEPYKITAVQPEKQGNMGPTNPHSPSNSSVSFLLAS
ncbi:uncharacterized protein [Rutidosis leptorrhynchoides]|uniref:uncharacterized protein n=1 Tax=Rutidosis leptorrhynchoides TaxID=125765 RepID=UPI003A999383